MCMLDAFGGLLLAFVNLSACVCVCVCVCVFLHSLECSRGIRIKKTKVSFQEFTSEPDLQSAGIKMNVLTQVLDFGRDSCGWFDRLLDLFLGRVGKMLYTTSQTNIDKRQIAFLVLFFIKTFLGAPFAIITAYFTF